MNSSESRCILYETSTAWKAATSSGCSEPFRYVNTKPMTELFTARACSMFFRSRSFLVASLFSATARSSAHSENKTYLSVERAAPSLTLTANCPQHLIYIHRVDHAKRPAAQPRNTRAQEQRIETIDHITPHHWNSNAPPRPLLARPTLHFRFSPPRLTVPGPMRPPSASSTLPTSVPLPPPRLTYLSG